MYSVELAPGIISYDGYIQDPSDFINNIELFVGFGDLEWKDATQTDGSKGSGSTVDKSARNCKVIGIKDYYEEDTIATKIKSKINGYLKRNLDSLFIMYATQNNALEWNIRQDWQILKYGPDNYFVEHMDDCKEYPRTISMVAYFNDDYEGGEIEFPRFGLKIKPKANQVLIFPSNYIYNHVVHPVTSGNRYAVVSWWE